MAEQASSRVDSVEDAWEIAEVVGTLMDLRPRKPSLVRFVLRPIVSMRDLREREELEDQAKDKADGIHQLIEKLSDVQGDEKVQALYGSLIKNLAATDITAAKELARVADMPGREVYKYEPESRLVSTAFQIAWAVHKGGGNILIFEGSKYSAEELTDVHVLCGTLQARGKVPSVLPAKDGIDVKTPSSLGFSIVENYTNPYAGSLVEWGTLGFPATIEGHDPILEVGIVLHSQS